MKRYWLHVLVVILLARLGPTLSPAANEAFQSGQVVLYNQMDEFASRSPSAEVLASFIKQLDVKAATLWKDLKSRTGRSGLIAVAIRPDRTMK